MSEPDLSSAPVPHLPVILLTGFLGAGKSTLLLRWLSESPATGLRPGIVMNEFGQESVDSQLLRRPGLPIRQVDGGCVCCAPESDLDRACRELVRSGLCDYLVLETSGLADPDNVIDVLTDPGLLEVVRLQAVVTVVDAEWYSRPGDGPAERVLARRQIQFAHVLCLSRCDRIGEAEVVGVEEEMRRLNSHARLVRLPFDLPHVGDILSAPSAGVELSIADPEDAGAPHLHTAYQSVAWRFPSPVSRSAFEGFLAGLDPREVIRIKGFVRFREQPGKLFLFQSVWGRHVIDEFTAKPDPETVAVLIGPALDAQSILQRLRGLVPRAAGLAFGNPRP